MSDNADQQAQNPDDTAEYLKFVALLVVLLVVILAVALLSPRLISEVTPSVLGLGDEPAAEQAPAMEEGPSTEDGPVAQPESSAAPELTAPAEVEQEAGAMTEGLQHEVQEGQTLYVIAEMYGVSVEEIAAANNLVSPSQLTAGTVLLIPQGP